MDIAADLTGVVGVGLTSIVAATAINVAGNIMIKAADKQSKMLRKRNKLKSVKRCKRKSK